MDSRWSLPPPHIPVCRDTVRACRAAKPLAIQERHRPCGCACTLWWRGGSGSQSPTFAAPIFMAEHSARVWCGDMTRSGVTHLLRALGVGVTHSPSYRRVCGGVLELSRFSVCPLRQSGMLRDSQLGCGKYGVRLIIQRTARAPGMAITRPRPSTDPSTLPNQRL